MYSKTCFKRPLEIEKTGILMKVGSIAECSRWSFWCSIEWPLMTGITVIFFPGTQSRDSRTNSY